MPRIIPNKASTRDYPKVQEGDEEEFYGYGPNGEAITSKKRRTNVVANIEAAIGGMEQQGINRINRAPSTAAPASEPPPTFNERDWNLKTG